MTELSIDTKRRTVQVRVELTGEKEPIDVQITRYTLKTNGDAASITIEAATASREWLAVALREFVIGRSLPLPTSAAGVLKLLA